jgi:hypothetical protein
MPTTFGELKRLVFLELRRSDGEAELAIEEAINRAHKAIARAQDFEELMVLDTTNAVTVASTKLYHLIDDLLLTRPKDIYTIRLMNDSNSRKLVWVPFDRLDEVIPYTEQRGEDRSKWYTQRGLNIELFPIPDDAYSLYIQYSQWPETLDAEDDTTPYLNLDDVIVTLGAEIALAILEGGSMTGWTQRAQILLGQGMAESRSKPDALLVAQPFNSHGSSLQGEYWLNPFIKGDR